MREEFEDWAVMEGYDVSRNISDQYIYMYTNSACGVWQHQQQKIDALKARIEELKKWTEDYHITWSNHG